MCRMDRKRRLTTSLIFLSAALHLSPPVFGQQTTGRIQGFVTDSSGQPIPLVNIIVNGPQGIRGAVSESNGSFVVQAIPPGTVSISLNHVAYQPIIFENVVIQLGKTTSLGTVPLHPRSHDIPEVIAIGVIPLIDPGTTTVGHNLRSTEFQDLPVERDYKALATLLPQANISYLNDPVNVAGATGRENKYFVDGMEVTDPSFSRTGTNLPYNFIREVEVSIGGYEAEYRSTLGGLVNVVTHSGGNAVHGTVFGFFTNNSLSAARKGSLLDPTQGGFSLYDAGIGIGGPVIPDELWFYAAYNPSVQKRDVEIPGLGTYEDYALTHAFAGKLSWKPSPSLDLTLTTTGDPQHHDGVGDTPPAAGEAVRLLNPDPYLATRTDGGVNVVLQGSFVASERMSWEASVSHLRRNETLLHATELGRTDSIFIDTETGIWSGGGFGNLDFKRSVTTARISGRLLAGDHAVKAGIEFRNIMQDADLDYPFILQRHSDTSYTVRRNGTHGSVNNQVYSGFLQDSWQVTSSFRIHAGVRWDGQQVLAGDGSIVHTVDGPLQPRIGIIFIPDEAGAHKISGSFGRFVQEWSSAVMTVYSGSSYFTEIKYSRDPRVWGFTGDSTVIDRGEIPPQTTLRGQHYDEFNLCYEALVGQQLKLSLLGTFRTIREVINNGITGDGLRMGNPGSGVLSEFPNPRRDYASLGLTLERRSHDGLYLLASYTLSRNYGNYEGLYDSYNVNIVPNVNWTYSFPSALEDATGLLPNDRTHVLKFSGSYAMEFGLSVGASFIWQSGTPLSDVASFGWFVQPRGTAGRTPSLWDLSARITYTLPLSDSWQTRFILDAYHIASQRVAVNYVQQHYFGVDSSGNPIDPNPLYGEASRYQPPMSLRLGVEVVF